MSEKEPNGGDDGGDEGRELVHPAPDNTPGKAEWEISPNARDAFGFIE